MTIRGIMIAVLFIAWWCGFWAYLRDWEARRVIMYQQRDVTRSIISGVQFRGELAANPTANPRGAMEGLGPPR